MRRAGKNDEQAQQAHGSKKKPAKVEPLRPQAEHLKKFNNDLAKFPEENPHPVLRIHKNGIVLYANKASEPLLKAKDSAVGLPAPPQWHRLAEKVWQSGQMAREEVEHNGRIFEFRAVPIAEADYVNFYGDDITERKIAEKEREIMIGLLRLINANNQMHELMRLVALFLRDWSGCEAVGIRLQEGEDYPYYVTSGFPKEFVLAENKLCSVNEAGELIRDSQGRAFLECMCGNIISGRFDLSKPFFTEHGSFWTNSTTDLLAGTTEADRLARTRNRCNTAGYESLALIPLRRTGGETFGLLQFNSKQRGRFTPERISLFERIADNLAIGLAQRKAERALREGEKRFSTVFHTSPLSIALTRLKDNTIVDVNEAWQKTTGFSREETIGHTPIELNSWVNPAERYRLIRMLCEQGTVQGFEFQLRQKTGDVSTLLLSAEPIEVEGEKCMLTMALDITERKKAEEELRKFKTISDKAGYGVTIVDLEGNVNYVNTSFSRMHGYTSDELIGKHLSIFHTEQQMANVNRLIEQLNREGSYVSQEVWHKRNDNTEFPTLMNGALIKDENGTPLFMAATAVDITERKLAEYKLTEHQKQLKQMALQLALTEERERRRIAGKLHDQLCQSLALAKIKLDALGASATPRASNEILTDASNTLQQLIDQTRLLTFDLSSPILYELGFEAAVSEWLNEQVHDKGGIETEFQDDHLPKPLDDDVRVLLFRNVRELLINVIKHSRASKVKVCIRRTDDSVEITVKDNGVGFDPEEAKIMAAKRAKFGLFSIRESLEQLGGHFKIESKPDAGCTATIIAPLKSQTREREEN